MAMVYRYSANMGTKVWRRKGLVIFYICSLSLSSTAAYEDNPLVEAAKKKISLERLDQCFCELTGQVDECCCDVETVDSLNRDKIHPLISSLITESYFRFFQVNLIRPCPFWPDAGRCVLKDCHVEKCTEDEIPAFLKGEEQEMEKAPAAPQVVESCDEVSEEEQHLSVIDSTISHEQREEFKTWQAYDDAEENFCELDDNPQDLSYYDLELNPERYTGYTGQSTWRIWRAIYRENCFKPEEELIQSSSSAFEPSFLQGMCLEKRAFYRLISGLHASINVHLSAQYIISGRGTSNPKFGPNVNEFVRRFDAATTNGQGPGWLKNLYFAYLLVLRAVEKAGSYWEAHGFYTGNTTEDIGVGEGVAEMVQAAKSCSSFLFDETMLFTGDTSQQLKNEFRAHFKNISRIMDCVECDKCRLWGKLQVQGMGTALKILFSERKLQLSRREIVALFNVLGRFSSSINSLEMLREMQAEETSRREGRSKGSTNSSKAPKEEL